MSEAFLKFLNERESRGRTALYLAVEAGRLDAVSVLLEFNADVNIPDKENKAPLFVACENGYAEIVTELLKNGADFKMANFKKDGAEKSCLEAAIVCRKPVDTLEALLSGNITVERSEFESILSKKVPKEADAQRLRDVFQAKLQSRAKAVSEGIKDVVPLPASTDKAAPLDIVSMYTGFSVDIAPKEAPKSE